LPSDDITAPLGGWEGYRVQRAKRRSSEKEGDPDEIWIELVRQPGRLVCSQCGRRCRKYHDVSERWVRDLPILDAQTWLLVPRFRAACPVCGPRVEYLSWLGKWSRVTKRLAESVGRLCEVLAIKHAAVFYGLGWDAVKQIHKAYLEERLGPPDLSGIDAIAMDEFAIQKGHRYATVIVEPRCKRVLWVGRGRGREDIRPFFERLGEEGRDRLQVAAIDMNPAYEEEVRAQCPGAEIVYDLFHVVAKYAREVIDRVRVDEANRLRHDKKARKVIKGSRWLLLRNRTSLTRRKDRVKLDELLSANRKLATVYVLKDDLI
jgi:transposase